MERQAANIHLQRRRDDRLNPLRHLNQNHRPSQWYEEAPWKGPQDKLEVQASESCALVKRTCLRCVLL